MDRALIDAAAQALVVESIFLRRSSIRCKEGFMPQFIENDLSLIPQYRFEPPSEHRVITATDQDTGDSTKTAVFHFVVGVRLIDGASVDTDKPEDDIPDKAVYIEIETEFCAQYGLDCQLEEKELNPALEEFGRYNVGYHVWPYWREYVQGTCARMGIPPIPVPIYRIPQSEQTTVATPEEKSTS